jgi:hypothetical protein
MGEKYVKVCMRFSDKYYIYIVHPLGPGVGGGAGGLHNHHAGGGGGGGAPHALRLTLAPTQ